MSRHGWDGTEKGLDVCRCGELVVNWPRHFRIWGVKPRVFKGEDSLANIPDIPETMRRRWHASIPELDGETNHRTWEEAMWYATMTARQRAEQIAEDMDEGGW